MKITAHLRAAKRATLEEHAAALDKLTAKHAALLRTLISWTEKRIEVGKQIVALEAKAEEGDLDASTKLYAVKDQEMRLGMSVERK